MGKERHELEVRIKLTSVEESFCSWLNILMACSVWGEVIMRWVWRNKWSWGESGEMNDRDCLYVLFTCLPWISLIISGGIYIFILISSSIHRNRMNKPTILPSQILHPPLLNPLFCFFVFFRTLDQVKRFCHMISTREIRSISEGLMSEKTGLSSVLFLLKLGESKGNELYCTDSCYGLIGDDDR